MQSFQTKLSEYQKVGILGIGITGEATYKFFKKHNIKTVIWDDTQLNRNVFSLKYHDAKIVEIGKEWEDCSHIVVSPGIPMDFPVEHKIVSFAKSNNIHLTSDIEILFHFAPNDAKFVCITGTNGKSTTTSMIGHILQESGVKSSVGGNIGIPVLDLPIDNRIYVLELSSFQLLQLNHFKADVAIILNITPDHIDRHGTMTNYINAKKRIYNNQSNQEYLILGIDNAKTAWIYDEEMHKSPKKNIVGISANSLNANHKNIVCFDEDLKLTDNFWSRSFKVKDNYYLQGKHNRENFAASYAASKAIGLDEKQIISAIANFVGLPHRMEFVAQIGNLFCCNDSKATNAEASKPALSTFKNIYWLVGGKQKEGGISELREELQNVHKAYIFGLAVSEFAEHLEKQGKNYEIFDNLASAFQKAYQDAMTANEEAVILLSPACASTDQFKNFEERGEVFRSLVHNIQKTYKDHANF